MKLGKIVLTSIVIALILAPSISATPFLPTDNDSVNLTFTTPPSYNNTYYIRMNLYDYIYDGSGKNADFELEGYQYNSTSPQDVNITIGNVLKWQEATTFNYPSNISNPNKVGATLDSVLQTKIPTCTCADCVLDGEYCNVKINVSVGSQGMIQLRNLYLNKGLRIITYNAENQTQNITYNVTLINSTSSTTHLNLNDYGQMWNNTTGGSVTAHISATGYETRTYYFTETTNGVVLKAYLLPVSSAAVVRFHVRNNAEQYLQNALVTASRLINTTWIPVDQELTDGSGTATLSLNPLVSYLINVTYGDTTSVQYITPTSTDYWITLGVDTDAGDQANVYAGIAQTVYPLENWLYLSDGGNGSINYTITAQYIDLVYYGMNITYNNTDVFGYNTTLTSAGGTIYGIFNISGASIGDNVNVRAYFKRTGEEEQPLYRTFIVANPITAGNSSINSILVGLTPDALGLSSEVRGFVAIILSLLLTVMIAGAIGFRGAGMIGLGLLGVFTFYGWLDSRVYFLTVAALIGGYSLTR